MTALPSDYGLNIATIIDVGVLYGTPWLYEAFPTAAIVMVDPLPEVQEAARRFPDRRIHVVQKAAAAESGRQRTLRIVLKPDGQRVDGRTGMVARSNLTDVEIDTKRQVETVTLDDIVRDLPKEFRPPYLLKIDTEGYEIEVLKGASATLRKADAVILEVSTKRRFKRDVKPSRLFALLARFDFEMFSVLGGSGPVSNYYDIMYVRYGSEAFDRNFRHD